MLDNLICKGDAMTDIRTLREIRGWLDRGSRKMSKLTTHTHKHKVRKIVSDNKSLALSDIQTVMGHNSWRMLLSD